MSEQTDQTGRPLFACSDCAIVYARFEEPEHCRICGNETFVEVRARGEPY